MSMSKQKAVNAFWKQKVAFHLAPQNSLIQSEYLDWEMHVKQSSESIRRYPP